MVSGMDFGDPQVQTMLTQLGMIEPDTFTDERVEIMQDWGVEARPRWTYEGFVEQPTLESIAAARAAHENQVHNQLARVAGVRFGEQFRRGDDAGAVMAEIWAAMK
jgi:hypothetical protein